MNDLNDLIAMLGLIKEKQKELESMVRTLELLLERRGAEHEMLQQSESETFCG